MAIITSMKNLIKISKSSLTFFGRHYTTKAYNSALFIPGSRATETFSLLSPYLNFDKRFANIEKLQRELEHRNLKINARELKKSWEFYQHIDSIRKTLEKRREEVAYRIKQLNKKKDMDINDKKEMEGLKVQGTVLKQDLRNIKEIMWEIEETVVIEVLKLPNEIDEKTPLEPVILRKIGKIPDLVINKKSHTEIGESLKLIEYMSPLSYYLCNEAALFEIGALSYAGKILSDEEIIKVSGTDFSRSLIVEATGLNHQDPFETFLLDNNEDIDKESCSRLHLIGGASLIAFLSMHTKQLINPKHFPLSYYATGKQYSPPNQTQLNSGLFNVCQSSVVQCFSLLREDTTDLACQNQFEKLMKTILKLYDGLGVHYRVVLRSAGELHNWESLRVSFDMWSSYLQQYIEVGHLSICGDYLTKRLLIAYQTSTGRDYPTIISGTILSVPRLLGCLIEENPTNFKIPSVIVPYMPVDNIK